MPPPFGRLGVRTIVRPNAARRQPGGEVFPIRTGAATQAGGRRAACAPVPRCPGVRPYSLLSASTGSRLAAMVEGMMPATSVSTTEMTMRTAALAGESAMMPETCFQP